MFNKELFDIITEFSDVFGNRKFNDDDNMNAYMQLVDKCIEFGNIPECNRKEFSTHGRLTAAISYTDNRYKFCTL